MRLYTRSISSHQRCLSLDLYWWAEIVTGKRMTDSFTISDIVISDIESYVISDIDIESYVISDIDIESYVISDIDIESYVISDIQGV